METRNSQLEHGQPIEQKRGVGFAHDTQVWLAVVSLLANEFDVRSVLHGQVSLAAVNQICAIHVAMNGCENLKIH